MVFLHADPDRLNHLQALLWTCVGLNADPDSAFDLNVDPDLDPQSDFEVAKILFLYEVNRSPNMPTEVKKAVLKGRKTCFLYKKFIFPYSWIRIRIPNTDPGHPNECGFMRIRIHNTACRYRKMQFVGRH